ncbi:MAG: hypothetical protein DI628_08025 [Blastochloris viridis]|uniref:DUF3617 family protein n=1 Tax=Blastochloris viridis TaxID=1079 RepID=A0A6N4R9R6_BLAVI|nr:MAG: hypothetical protein DI628_08025 [Blastochloris viridis]
MKMMRVVLGVCFLLCMNVSAQERTAGVALDSQMTWTAMSSRVDAVNNRVTATNAQVSQMMKCNAKLKVYAPGTQGADAKGCVAVSAAPSSLNIQSHTQTLCVRGGYH